MKPKYGKQEENMNKRRRVDSLFVCLMMAFILSLSFSHLGMTWAADWMPKSEVTFIVPYAPGGATDPISRMLVMEAEPLLKQKLRVVHRGGSAGGIATSRI